MTPDRERSTEASVELPAEGAPVAPPSGRVGAVAALCGVQLVDVLGVTSGITALPAMLAGVSAPPGSAPVVATAYATCFGGLLVLGARLGDRHGHRRVLLAGTAAFVVVALVGATAESVVQLVAARAAQGAAAAVGVPCALRLLLDVAPGPAQRRAALAAWSASGAVAGALGLLVGGVVTDLVGWRAVFWVNLPIGLALLVAIRLTVSARHKVHEVGEGGRHRLDVTGAALLVAAVMAVVVGASLVEAPAHRVTGVGLAAVGLLGGALFVAHQRRVSQPLVAPAAWTSAPLRSGTFLSFVNTATTSSAAVLATLLLQEHERVSAVGAGVRLLPFSLGVVLGASACPALGARLGPRHLAATGLGAIAAGNATLAVTVGSGLGLAAAVGVVGAGLGVASVAATAIGTDVGADLTGTATGVLNTGAQLGTAVGVAVLLVLASTWHDPVTGTSVAWGVAGTVAAFTAVALLAQGNRRSRASSTAR